MDLSLRWFRFSCFDLDLLMEFWLTGMKMQMERQLETNEEIRTSFIYPGDKIGLRFELSRRSISSRSRSVDPVGSISLVIYVENLDDFVGRLSELGFSPYAPITQIHPNIRCAVFVDPSGLKIRLLESSIFYPFPANSNFSMFGDSSTIQSKISLSGSAKFSSSLARLGSVNVPVRDFLQIERSIQFYEQTFLPSHSILNAQQTAWKRAFKCVDQEFIGEDKISYYWLSNFSRKTQPSLCLIHKSSNRENSSEIAGDSKSIFLGLSFYVSDLDACVALLRRQEAISESRLEILNYPSGFPRHLEFFDAAFIPVEISDNSIQPPGLGRRNSAIKNSPAPPTSFSMSQMKTLRENLDRMEQRLNEKRTEEIADAVNSLNASAVNSAQNSPRFAPNSMDQSDIPTLPQMQFPAGVIRNTGNNR